MGRWIAIFAAAIACCALAPPPVVRIADLAYVSDGADKHRLDLYLPEHRDNAPLVLFVHGGAFMEGDRKGYAAVGEALANQGMAVAILSYRLFPQTDAQGSAHDVALAIAWIVRHAGEYAVDPNNVFLAGHSAGAQIVAQIGTHSRYLQAVGTSPLVLRGVFALAGAYDVRDLSDEPDSWQRVDGHIYGESANDRAAISPAVDIDSTSPGIEAACGTDDDPGSCDRAIWFARALRSAGVDGSVYKEIGADHMGVLRAFIDSRDPLNREFHEFIIHHTRKNGEP